MNFPDKATVDEIRRRYPLGCRVVLNSMDDIGAPPPGTQGTVCAIDDVATVHCAWDNGSSLGVALGADHCHKIATEEEAKVTLDWYGKHQPDEDARCPRCGNIMYGTRLRHAISRYADITVCDSCGVAEALECAGLIEKTPLMKWCACVIPQAGGGKWRR